MLMWRTLILRGELHGVRDARKEDGGEKSKQS